jgi:signal transduction histidine kinase
MYERAELLGGHLSIQSAIDHGTRVSLDLPLRAVR